MIHAKQALLADGWAQDVRLHLSDGMVAKVETGVAGQAGDSCVDTLLPALSNLHSHSFQRAMAGMTEQRAAGRDSFWTWRDLMYRFVDRLTPDQVEAIAALTFMEMQEAGYAAVGEFHYLHHQPGGAAYGNIAELSERIAAAAAQTGIGLCLLPVLYSYGGADKQPLSEGQLRFGNDLDRFAHLYQGAESAIAKLPADARLGIAPHSLRAVSPEDLRDIQKLTHSVIHIHIAEQVAEIEQILAAFKARPVEWLMDNFDLSDHWCLIHATHMTADETQAVAQSGAVAGLCPITEANLGDGIFNGQEFLCAGGRFGIGSDSNVNISLTEELRLLEYSQRYRDLSRNVMIAGEGSVGQALYLGAAEGGAQALARNAGRIAPGQLADLVAIDSTSPALCALNTTQLLDGLVFAAKDEVVTDLWSAGRHCVRDGQHHARDAIVTRYRAVMQELMAQI